LIRGRGLHFGGSIATSGVDVLVPHFAELRDICADIDDIVVDFDEMLEAGAHRGESGL
jgi:hypothetical protein